MDKPIRILVDEGCLNIKKAFRGDPNFDVVDQVDLGLKRGDPDSLLIKKATEDDRFFLTKDFKTVTETLYPPCTGKSILRFPKNKVSKDYIRERVIALKDLFLVARAKNHFTYLEDEGIKIVALKEIIERQFNDYAQHQNIPRD